MRSGLKQGLTESKAGKARAWLEKNNMAKTPEREACNKTWPVSRNPGLGLSEVRQKAAERAREVFEHKCHVDHLKSWLEDRGYTTWLEAKIDGMKGSFDIFAWIEGSKGKMYGFEITHSFGNLKSNIEGRA